MKIHPWRFFDHSRAVHSVLASVFLWEQPETVGDEAQRAEHTGTLVRRGWVDQRGQFGVLHAVVDLLRVRHPLHQLLRRGQFEKQMGEYFLRAFDEKLALLIIGGLEQ